MSPASKYASSHSRWALAKEAQQHKEAWTKNSVITFWVVSKQNKPSNATDSQNSSILDDASSKQGVLTLGFYKK